MVHDVVPWLVSEIFDATSIDTTSHEPIKAGTYEAVITASEIKANRANTGKGLNLTFEISSDSAKGRKVWAWINFQHQKQEAQLPKFQCRNFRLQRADDL